MSFPKQPDYSKNSTTRLPHSYPAPDEPIVRDPNAMDGKPVRINLAAYEEPLGKSGVLSENKRRTYYLMHQEGHSDKTICTRLRLTPAVLKLIRSKYPINLANLKRARKRREQLTLDKLQKKFDKQLAQGLSPEQRKYLEESVEAEVQAEMHKEAQEHTMTERIHTGDGKPEVQLPVPLTEESVASVDYAAVFRGSMTAEVARALFTKAIDMGLQGERWAVQDLLDRLLGVAKDGPVSTALQQEMLKRIDLDKVPTETLRQLAELTHALESGQPPPRREERLLEDQREPE